MLEITVKGYGSLKLEHSLIAISKWEEKWHVSFLSTKEKTPAQMIDYIRCMTINHVGNPEIYDHLDVSNIEEIKDYILDPHTATTFGKSWQDEVADTNKAPKKGEIITAELVYYWMIANNIPMDREKWHIQKLITLIRVCAIKNTPPDKKGKRRKLSASDQQSMLAQRQALNAQRKAKLGTTG